MPVIDTTPKPLSSYDWNGKRYTIMQMADGSRLEVKGKVTDAPSIFLAKATACAVALAAENACWPGCLAKRP
jgi:hypothetical protein